MATLIVGESPCRIPQILDIIRNSGNLSLFHSNWEEFAKRLGVPEKSILELNNDLKWKVINLEGLLTDVLYTWKGNCGDDATLGVLYQALTDSQVKDIADELEEKLAEILKSHVLATGEVCVQSKRIKISDIFTAKLHPRTSKRFRRNLDPIQILKRLEIPEPYVSTVPLGEFIQCLVDQLDEQELKVVEGFSFKRLFPQNLAEILNAECDYDEGEARKLVQLEQNRVLWFVAAKGVLNAKLNEQQRQQILAYVFACEENNEAEDSEAEDKEETDVTILAGKKKSYKFKREKLVEFVDWLLDNGYAFPSNFQLDSLDHAEACLNYKKLARNLFSTPNSRVYSLPGLLHRLVQHTMLLHASELEERVNLVLKIIRENPGSVKSLNQNNLPPLLMDKIHVGLIHVLIYSGANVNAVDQFGANFVHVAAKYLPSEQFQKLVRFLAHENLTHLLNAGDSIQQTPLFHLIRYNAKSDPSTLQVLASAGADFNARDKNGETVLVLAVWLNRSIETLEALGECGADWNWRSSTNRNLLHHAAWEGNLEAVTCFVRLGLDVNSRDNDLNTPLIKAVMNAAKGCNVEVIKFLLESNADANATEKTGRTVLSLAVENNRSVEVLQALVAYGANWNWKDDDGSNLLHEAAYEGNLEAVKYFVGLGLDVNSRDKDLDTPVMYAVMNADATKGWVEVVKFLLESNANVNARNKHDNTVLSLAVINNSCVETLQALVAYGADWHWKDVNNANLLHEAAYEGNLQAVKYFVRLGIDINSRDNELHTPLMYTFVNDKKRRNVEVVKILLENNADVNVIDKYGNTPLQYAHQLKQSEVDELLISKGATPLSKTEKVLWT